MSKSEIQENLSQADISGAEQGKQEPGLELVKGPELYAVVETANDLVGKMEGDQNVTGEDVVKLDEAMGKVKLNVGGEMMTIDEIREIPDLKENIKIFERIKQGEVISRDLSYITPFIMGVLLDNMHRENSKFLDLSKLKSISEDVAREIGNDCVGLQLYLDSVENVSDEVMTNLCRTQAIKISLMGLKNLSENSMKGFAERKNKKTNFLFSRQLTVELYEYLEKYIK